MDLYNKQLEQRQASPDYWLSKSHDLLVSAHTLWIAMQSEEMLEINCWATYKMLMGMSFELLFKAHCIGSGKDSNPTHDLVALAKTAGLTTSKDENKILNVLSQYIIWDGRYPIPKKPENLRSHWNNQADLLDDKLDFENLMPLWKRFSDSYGSVQLNRVVKNPLPATA